MASAPRGDLGKHSGPCLRDGVPRSSRRDRASLPLAREQGLQVVAVIVLGEGPGAPSQVVVVEPAVAPSDLLGAGDPKALPQLDGLDEVGEMVIKQPMPSMPVFLWGDQDHQRYTESYFDMFPGIWRHGDWTSLTPRKGVVIYGRSDSTLNRGGVRIGTSEIYRAVDTLNEVEDSLVVNYVNRQEEDRMPLFVKLKSGVPLNDALVKLIKQTIRQSTSPRHVPDEVIAIEAVPYTISGKKMETPIKKILEGADPEKVVKKDAMQNPMAIAQFLAMTKK